MNIYDIYIYIYIWIIMNCALCGPWKKMCGTSDVRPKKEKTDGRMMMDGCHVMFLFLLGTFLTPVLNPVVSIITHLYAELIGRHLFDS